MSYGEGVPPLELADVRLACLSGDNGNGKSALLDAMTWALFGETRARIEDDIIRLGAKSCGVLFDFEVAGVRYRIDKRRDKSRGASWEFQARQDDGSFRSLSGTNARETKEKISQTLRLDYKTFLSTAYLKQGEADAFARSTAGERKDVLARILDLSRYDALEALAKEKFRDAQSRETEADRTLTEIDVELESEDSLTVRFTEAQKQLAESESAVELAQKDLALASARSEALETDERRAHELAEKRRDAEESLARDRYDERESENRLQDAERTLARKTEIEGALARRTALTEKLSPLETQWGQGLALQNDARVLDNVVRDARSALEREIYALGQELQVLTREASDRDGLLKEKERWTGELAPLSDMDAQLASADQAQRDSEQKMAALKAENLTAKAEIEKRERRLSALLGGDAPECEWCGQSLPPDAREKLLSETQAALDERRAALDALLDDARRVRRTADEARARLEAAQQAARQVEGLRARIESLDNQIQRLEDRAATRPEREKRHDALQNQLSENRFAETEQKKLFTLTEQIAALESVGREVEQLRGELSTLQGVDRDAERLRVAQEVARAEPERLKALRETIAKRVGQIEKARALIAELETKTRDLVALRQAQSEAQKRAQEAQSALAYCQRLLGQLGAERERLEKRKAERVALAELREVAVREKETFRELTAAFGKRGVQALIIENALPELEEEANRLLERMTQGAIRVRLQTTREAKTKGVSAIETLDIILADDLGTRPYELYSGGEAFRVNLALRVALSKTLARRAGAPLQTLILDEGFGTQDPRGREAIADALHAVAEDFSLVLVITHIEELKESFPTRIEVIKTDTGSTFSLQ